MQGKTKNLESFTFNNVDFRRTIYYCVGAFRVLQNRNDDTSHLVLHSEERHAVLQTAQNN